MKYSKTIIAIGFALAQAAFAAFTGDGHVDPVEWVTILTAGFTAAAVYFGPNTALGSGLYTKFIMAALGAGLVAASSAAIDGFQAADLKPVGIAALNAVLVFAFPNSQQ